MTAKPKEPTQLKCHKDNRLLREEEMRQKNIQKEMGERITGGGAAGNEGKNDYVGE